MNVPRRGGNRVPARRWRGTGALAVERRERVRSAVLARRPLGRVHVLRDRGPRSTYGRLPPSARRSAFRPRRDAAGLAADGRELYYLAPDRTLMAVPVQPGSERLEFGPPVPLFKAPVANPLGAQSLPACSRRTAVPGQHAGPRRNRPAHPTSSSCSIGPARCLKSSAEVAGSAHGWRLCSSPSSFFLVNPFLSRHQRLATWLVLALQGPFLALAGTIAGTASAVALMSVYVKY